MPDAVVRRARRHLGPRGLRPAGKLAIGGQHLAELPRRGRGEAGGPQRRLHRHLAVPGGDIGEFAPPFGRRDVMEGSADGLRIGHGGGRHQRRVAVVQEIAERDVDVPGVVEVPVSSATPIVDVAEVVRPVPIGRIPDLAGAQRDPAHRRPAAEIDAEKIADEADQRRGIDRPVAEAPRHPAPAMVEMRPAPVMEGGESPACVVDPGPAPGRDIGPMAVAIGRPVDGDLREPGRAVVGSLLPLAVLAEILGTRHGGRDILLGLLLGLLLGGAGLR